jgi:hypothetical protein
VVPLGQRAVLSASKRCVVQQESLIGRLEDSIGQHERACAEKRQLEEDLKSKSELGSGKAKTRIEIPNTSLLS